MKARKSKLPDEITLKQVRDEFSDLSYKGGNLALPNNASEVDRAKYDVCQIIAKYKRLHVLKQKDIATKLEIDESRVSDILRGKIAGFTLDRLVGYAEKLHPGLKVRIVAA